MTEQEFLRLAIGMVVADHFDSDACYVIEDEDHMGTAYTGKPYRVYGARRLDDGCLIRISLSNCQFWQIVGKVVE